jgi:opacity protein-like surface antigen
MPAFGRTLMGLRPYIVLGFMVLAIVCLSGAMSADWLPPANLIGKWKGETRIVVAWTKQRRLPVSIAIAADGTVTGSIGDAKLVSGRVQSDRNDIERAFNLARDFIVVGALQGPVIAAEGITRDRVYIPFDFKVGQLVGGLSTSGTTFGGKDSMILTAQQMKLNLIAGLASQPVRTTQAASEPTTQQSAGGF